MLLQGSFDVNQMVFATLAWFGSTITMDIARGMFCPVEHTIMKQLGLVNFFQFSLF
jgi:hypothetical protein